MHTRATIDGRRSLAVPPSFAHPPHTQHPDIPPDRCTQPCANYIPCRRLWLPSPLARPNIPTTWHHARRRPDHLRHLAAISTLHICNTLYSATVWEQHINSKRRLSPTTQTHLFCIRPRIRHTAHRRPRLYIHVLLCSATCRGVLATVLVPSATC